MPTSVSIDGVGVVNFPDEMSHDDISSAIRKFTPTPSGGSWMSGPLADAGLKGTYNSSDNSETLKSKALNIAADVGDKIGQGIHAPKRWVDILMASGPEAWGLDAGLRLGENGSAEAPPVEDNVWDALGPQMGGSAASTLASDKQRGDVMRAMGMGGAAMTTPEGQGVGDAVLEPTVKKTIGMAADPATYMAFHQGTALVQGSAATLFGAAAAGGGLQGLGEASDKLKSGDKLGALRSLVGSGMDLAMAGFMFSQLSAGKTPKEILSDPTIEEQFKATQQRVPIEQQFRNTKDKMGSEMIPLPEKGGSVENQLESRGKQDLGQSPYSLDDLANLGRDQGEGSVNTGTGIEAQLAQHEGKDFGWDRVAEEAPVEKGPLEGQMPPKETKPYGWDDVAKQGVPVDPAPTSEPMEPLEGSQAHRDLAQPTTQTLGEAVKNLWGKHGIELSTIAKMSPREIIKMNDRLESSRPKGGLEKAVDAIAEGIKAKLKTPFWSGERGAVDLSFGERKATQTSNRQVVVDAMRLSANALVKSIHEVVHPSEPGTKIDDAKFGEFFSHAQKVFKENFPSASPKDLMNTYREAVLDEISSYRKENPKIGPTMARRLSELQVNMESHLETQAKAKVLGNEGYWNKERGAVGGPPGDSEPIVKRAADFRDSGDYEVTVHGETHKIYRDPSNGWWFLDTASNLIKDKHWAGRSIGFNKADAVAKVATLVKKKQFNDWMKDPERGTLAIGPSSRQVKATAARRAKRSPTSEFIDQAYEARRNMILPATVMGKKIVSDTLMQAEHIPLRGIAGIIEQTGLRNAIQKRLGPRGDAVVHRRLKDMGTHIQALFDPTVGKAALDAASAGWNESPYLVNKHSTAREIPGELGRAIRIPQRALAIPTNFYMELTRGTEQRVWASEVVEKKGFTGARKEAELNRLAHLPLDKLPENIQHRLVDKAAEKTLLGEMGAIGKAIQAARQSLHLRWASPFLQISMNMIKAGYQRSPLYLPEIGAKVASGKLEGGAFADELAKPILWTPLALGLLAIAKNTISGPGPASKSMQYNKQAYWQGDSIRVGDKWYSVHALGPFGKILSMVGAVADARDEKDGKKKAQMLWNAINENADPSTIQDTAALLSLLKWDDNGFQKKLNRTSGTLLSSVLIPRLISKLAESGDTDPNGRLQGRKTDIPEDPAWMGPIRYLQRDIPGAREKLPLLRGVTGKPITRDAAFPGENLINPFPHQTDPGGPMVEKEFEHLDWLPKGPPKSQEVKTKVGNIKTDLSPEERDQVMDANLKATARATKEIQKPSYDHLPAGRKQIQLERIYRQERERALRHMKHDLRMKAKGMLLEEDLPQEEP